MHSTDARGGASLRRLFATAIVLVHSALSACASPAAAQATGPTPESSGTTDIAPVAWRQNFYCGVNCLYVMLKMFDKPVAYEALCEQTSITAQGSSMAELARVAAIHGIRLTPTSASRGSLDRWPLPAIVHLQQADDFTGHFVLYLNRRGTTHRVLDCTSGRMLDLSEGDFFNLWSGRVLLRSGAVESSSETWVAAAWLLTGAGVLGYGLWRRTWSGTRSRVPATDAAGPAPTG